MPPAHDYRALRVLMIPDLPHGLVEHIDRVVATAAEYVDTHHLDAGRTLLAAQAHDILRALPPEQLLTTAEARGLVITDADRAAPVLLHGPLGALALEKLGWVTDLEVLHAVRYHTTGHPDFTLEAWAMFVADKVEPNKLARWPALEAVTELAEHSLEEAALTYLDLSKVQALRAGWLIHPLAEETRRALRRRIAARG